MELLGAFCKNGGGPKDNRTFLIGIFHVAAKAPSWSARLAEYGRRRATSPPPLDKKAFGRRLLRKGKYLRSFVDVEIRHI